MFDAIIHRQKIIIYVQCKLECFAVRVYACVKVCCVCICEREEEREEDSFPLLIPAYWDSKEGEGVVEPE